MRMEQYTEESRISRDAPRRLNVNRSIGLLKTLLGQRSVQCDAMYAQNEDRISPRGRKTHE